MDIVFGGYMYMSTAGVINVVSNGTNAIPMEGSNVVYYPGPHRMGHPVDLGGKAIHIYEDGKIIMDPLRPKDYALHSVNSYPREIKYLVRFVRKHFFSREG